MQMQHQHVLAVILVGQLAGLNGGAETAGNVGVTGVGGVAVDVSLHTALTDHHVPVAASGASPDGEVLLALTQDLGHCGIGLAVGGEAAKADGVTTLDVLRDRVVQTHNLVHDKTSQ